MFFFGKFFRRRKRGADFWPEVVKIFEKIEHVLIDDDAQNAALPESMRKVIEAGPAVDGFPETKGEFGRRITNPVLANGAVGELACLSRLVTPSGARTPYIHHVHELLCRRLLVPNRSRDQRVHVAPIGLSNVAELLASARFVRTLNQNARLGELAELGTEPAASYEDAGG